MNYHYCQACFKKTPKTVDGIRFCVHCGKSFGEDEHNLYPSQHKIVSQLHNLPPKPKQTLRDKLCERLKFKEFRQQSTDNDANDLLDNDDDIESDYNAQVPDIHKLDLEVDIPRDQGIAISNIAQGAKRQTRLENTNNEKVKFNKERFWAQYQKEASSIRKK